MWGDNLPHCAWVLCCLQCLRIGSCLEVCIFVSTGCRSCQIIIDASLESISCSTNKATVSGDLHVSVRQNTEQRQTLRTDLHWGKVHAGWQMNMGRESWETGEVLLCVEREAVLLRTCHRGRRRVLSSKKIPPQVLEVPLSPKILTSWIKKKGWIQCKEVKTALIDSFILTTDKKKTVCNVKGVVVVMHPKRITRSQRYFQIRARRRDF